MHRVFHWQRTNATARVPRRSSWKPKAARTAAALVLVPAATAGYLGATATAAGATQTSNTANVSFRDLSGATVNCTIGYSLKFGDDLGPNTLIVQTFVFDVTGRYPECVQSVTTQADASYYQQSDGTHVDNVAFSQSPDVAGIFTNVKSANILTTHTVVFGSCDPELSACDFRFGLAHPK